MFLKLLKTDFKYYSRNFFIIVINILMSNILIIPIVNLSKSSSTQYIAQILTAISVILLSVAFLGTVFSIIKIFNNKFIGQESYLTFSLPVKKYKHLLSTLIVSIVWSIIILVVGCLTIIFSFYWINHDAINITWRSFFDMNSIDFSIFFLFIAYIILSLLLTCLLIYFCIVLVNVTIFKRSPRLFGGVLYGLVGYFVMKINLLMFNWGHSYFNEVIQHHTGATKWSMVEYNWIAIELLMIAVTIVFSLVFYFLTLYLMNKKLEVD